MPLGIRPPVDYASRYCLFGFPLRIRQSSCAGDPQWSDNAVRLQGLDSRFGIGDHTSRHPGGPRASCHDVRVDICWS